MTCVFFFREEGGILTISGIMKKKVEKSGGMRRPKSSFKNFRSFSQDMEIEKVSFVGSRFTWANNRADEGFVEERLDRFFRTPNLQIKFSRAKVIHVEKQTSDLFLLMLATKLRGKKLKAIFV